MSKKTKKLTMTVILDRILRGWSDKQICSRFRISTTSLAAYKANLTRQGF